MRIGKPKLRCLFVHRVHARIHGAEHIDRSAHCRIPGRTDQNHVQHGVQRIFLSCFYSVFADADRNLRQHVACDLHHTVSLGIVQKHKRRHKLCRARRIHPFILLVS